MKKYAKLILDAKTSINLPIVVGSENEKAGILKTVYS